SGRPLPVLSRQPAGARERPTAPSRQEAWSRARPARQRPSPRGNGRSPDASDGGAGGYPGGTGKSHDAADGSGPPEPSSSDGSSAPGPGTPAGKAPTTPARNGLAF